MRPLSIRLCCMLLCLFAFSAQAAVNTFWSQPQRGGNSFNEQPPDRAYFDALRATGATWVRLTPDKWRSAGGRDFLMGNADRYQGLVPADVATLRRVLDDADAAGIKVVLVPLSLPLLRWKQKNGGVVDQRLWQSFDNHRPAQAFWRDLARALHGHPALVAYNLINEPAPEYGTPLREHADLAAMRAWYATVKDGPRDLPRFYTGLIPAVREVDADMPLMLDPGWYAAADALAYWPAPLKDPHLLYSVHMYEPYAATSAPNQKRATPYRYPAVVPFGPGKTQWDAKRVASYLQQPRRGPTSMAWRATRWWSASSAACAAGRIARPTWRMSCACSRRRRCTGRSTLSARTRGMAWTTNWATPHCRGRTGVTWKRGRCPRRRAPTARSSRRSSSVCALLIADTRMRQPTVELHVA
ncbi:cellulase family glycosylhydrolase [Stenotrophomonas rhizophila]